MVALLAEYEGKAVLLGGDAFPSVLLASLKRLAAERGLATPLPLACGEPTGGCACRQKRKH